MKNITFSADEALIEAAREKAKSNNTTLNAEFRSWLAHYSNQDGDGQKRVEAAQKVMEQMHREVKIGRKYSREELNER